MTEQEPLVVRARRALADHARPRGAAVPENVNGGIASSINSQTKSYRCVLPTQLVAKLVEPSLDCRAVQEGSDLAGAFDARSFCRAVIVEFDRQNHGVLGGSGDPYVNNPLRIPATTPAYRANQRNAEGFDQLCAVLAYAQENPDRVGDLLDLVLSTIRQRLASVNIVYPVPNRVSLDQANGLLSEFLQTRSGGVRLQAVSVALFRTIGQQFHLFDNVVSRNVNVADSATGSAADLECCLDAGQVVVAVEVKDRQLTLVDMQDKLDSARAQGIREILYLVRGGVRNEDCQMVASLTEREFNAGQNVYVADFEQFLASCMILFQEEGRRMLLQHIGLELDEHADLEHRQVWRDMLAGI